MSISGRLFGVGVGPGDPELMTIKARNAIEAADVIAYPGAEHGRSVARRIASPYLGVDQIEVPLRYPVTTEIPRNDPAYRDAIRAFYDDAAASVLEVHVLDFDDDLYGQTVKVRIAKWLHGEERFESVDDLVAQMQRDVAATREAVKI